MSNETTPSGEGWRFEPPRKQRKRRSILEELARAGESAGRLARGHLDLAKLEAKEEVRKTALDGGLGIGALPLAFAGLLMLDVALALGIASWLGAAWAFLIVGILNLGAAGTMGIFAAARLRKQPRMEVLRTELERNKSMVCSLGARLRRAEPPAGGGSLQTPAARGTAADPRLRPNGPAHPEPEGPGYREGPPAMPR